MIYITGDTHSCFDRFSKKHFPQQRDMTKKDTVIIAGDFGGVWYGKNDRTHWKSESGPLDELDQRPFTTVFVPGNHENYDRLMSDEFPERIWNRGRVKEIRSSVLMLMRGEVFEIDGVRVFAFGGARSHDVSDGILDPADPDWKAREKRLKRGGKRMYRIKGISWWENELPTPAEMEHGLETLKEHGWEVDIVVTHCAPTSVQEAMGIHEADALTDYLESIRKKLKYQKWYFGHYHGSGRITEKDILLYKDITPMIE